MKKLLILSFHTCFSILLFAQTSSVGIGTTSPNASAALDIQSTTRGLLVPRLTSVQKNAIASPAAGLLVYDTNTGSFWFKSSTNWIELVDTLNNAWKKSGNNVFFNNSGNVGIGVTNPTSRLDVNGQFVLRNSTTTFGLMRHYTAADLNINSGMGNSLNGTPPGDLLLQIPQTGFPAGNVGIGTPTPAARLDVDGNIRMNGEVQSVSTGPANLVPICYGIVSTANGTIVSGTGNFTVQKDAIVNSDYYIDILGMDLDPEASIILVSTFGNNISAYVGPKGSIFQVASDFRIVVNGVIGQIKHFYFVVYKP
jgi:hypothetical protein